MNPKEHEHVGKRASYVPRMLDDDVPTVGIIKMYCPRGDIFEMDMVALGNLDHWVPAHECTILED